MERDKQRTGGPEIFLGADFYSYGSCFVAWK